MTTIVTAVRAELARLTASRMGTVALIALMTIPVIYGGLYLYGNKDPYGSLDRVPAAVVVDDAGATVDDARANYGRDAADALLDDGTFAWTEVSAAEAEGGVESGRFDFALEFPEDFSHDLASAGDTASDPVQASIALITDDRNSYLSTTLAKQAAQAVRVSVTAELGRSATLTLLDGIDRLRDGLSDAADGSGELADGATTAADGAASLASGTGELSGGASELSAGLTTLEDSTSALPTQAAQLASGSQQVSDGLTAAGGSLTTLQSGASRTATGAAELRDQLAVALAASALPADVQAQLLAGAGQVAAGAQGTSDGVDTASTKLGALTTGAQQVAAGAGTLSASAPQLTAGIASAADGAAQLAAGASTAASGASELSAGVGQLRDGATELHSELADGVAETPATTEAGRTSTAEAVADPVAVDQTALTEAQNYGAGLAPFFISLAAWIGIYALFLLVRPLSRRALTAVRRPIRTALAGWATPALLGGVQMIALFALVTAGLHLEVAQPVQLLAFMVLVSMTYAAIVLALNVLLGSVGQFLGLLLMIVQLVTAGGTFPWQTLPAPLALLHQALPMSHAVDGIRQLMYGGAGGSLAGAVLPLVAWMLVSLAAAALGALKQGRFRTLRELRPSPIGG